MGKIIFVTNFLGKKEVVEDIAFIASKAKDGISEYQALSKYIAQALVYLKEINVPEGVTSYLLGWDTTDYLDDDRPLKFYIVKKVVSRPSVFEFRINWEPLYFRALFFVDSLNEEQYKFLTRSLLKEEKNPPELQQKINETELVSQMYKMNPLKYVKEWSE